MRSSIERRKPAQDVNAEERRVYTPRTDIFETEHATVLLADIPGASETSVVVSLERGILGVKAVPEQHELEAFRLQYQELEPAEFRCHFEVEPTICREDVQVEIADGVVKIVLPKVGAVQVLKIPPQN